MCLIVSDLPNKTSCQRPPECSGTDGFVCVPVMLIKADIHRSGGTRPSVLLSNIIISITEAKRKTQRDKDRWKETGREFREGEGKTFILISASVPCAAMLMCVCVREDGIISLMVLTHLVLSCDLVVGFSHVTIVELPTVSRKRGWATVHVPALVESHGYFCNSNKVVLSAVVVHWVTLLFIMYAELLYRPMLLVWLMGLSISSS